MNLKTNAFPGDRKNTTTFEIFQLRKSANLVPHCFQWPCHYFCDSLRCGCFTDATVGSSDLSRHLECAYSLALKLRQEFRESRACCVNTESWAETGTNGSFLVCCYLDFWYPASPRETLCAKGLAWRVWKKKDYQCVPTGLLPCLCDNLLCHDTWNLNSTQYPI